MFSLFRLALACILCPFVCQAQSLKWVDPSSPNAAPKVIGGTEEGGPLNGTYLYVCHAQHGKDLIPGKEVAGFCNIPYFGNEIMVRPYEVLVGSASWGPPFGGTNVGNAVVGGHEGGANVYICRARFDNHGVHPGKLVFNSGGLGMGYTCYIPWGQHEHGVGSIEVLYTAPYIAPRPSPQTPNQPNSATVGNASPSDRTGTVVLILRDWASSQVEIRVGSNIDCFQNPRWSQPSISMSRGESWVITRPNTDAVCWRRPRDPDHPDGTWDVWNRKEVFPGHRDEITMK